MSDFGTLEEAPLRDAWDHEALSFTPWLSENLDRLGRELGINIQHEGSEVGVGVYSADLLARNIDDESLILIENQLERSDHAHLGQIMTYLAGLEARTIIWIAADFNESHLSAINWLNDNTSDEFSFFAVRVKAVRIGNSPIAPVFEIVARPSNWERRLKSLARKTSEELTDLGSFRKQFWTHYLKRFPEDLEYDQLTALSHRTHNLDPLGLKLVLFVNKGNEGGVGLFIGLQGNEVEPHALAKLEANRDKLEQALNTEMGRGTEGQFFIKRKKGNTNNTEKWDDLVDWLHGASQEYEETLYRILQEK